jgi:hypothetical protein
MSKFKSDDYYRLRIIVILGSVVQRFSHMAMQVSQYAQPNNHSYVFLTILNTLNLLYNISSQLVLSLFILMTMGKEGKSLFYWGGTRSSTVPTNTLTLVIYIRLETIAPNTLRIRKFVFVKSTTYIISVFIILLVVIRFIGRQVYSNFMDDPLAAPSPVFVYFVVNVKDLVLAVSLVIEIILDFILNSKMIYRCLKHIEEKSKASQQNSETMKKPSSFALFLHQSLSVIRAAPLTTTSKREEAALQLKRKMVLSFISLMMTDMTMIALTALGGYVVFYNYGTEFSAIISSWCTVRVYVMIELLDCFLNGLKNVSSYALIPRISTKKDKNRSSESNPKGNSSIHDQPSFWASWSKYSSDGFYSQPVRDSAQKESVFATDSFSAPAQSYNKDYDVG